MCVEGSVEGMTLRTLWGVGCKRAATRLFVLNALVLSLAFCSLSCLLPQNSGTSINRAMPEKRKVQKSVHASPPAFWQKQPSLPLPSPCLNLGGGWEKRHLFNDDGSKEASPDPTLPFQRLYPEMFKSSPENEFRLNCPVSTRRGGNGYTQ